METVQRTLRIKNQGSPVRKPLASRWQYGQGPTLWATQQQTAPAAVAESTLPVAQPASPKPAEVKPGPATSQPIPGNEAIKTFVLAAVSEKTGYPVEVLDLNLDLEADLGIDTVKQAELFASIREQYGIPRREDLRLADYNTLAKVILFVAEALGPAAAPAQETEPAVPQAVIVPPETQAASGTTAGDAEVNFESIKAYILSAVSEKTGYPIEVLDLDLDLEADLGIDTVKQAELFASIRGQYSIPRRDDLRLADYNTLARVIRFVEESLGPVAAPANKTPASSQQAAAVSPKTQAAAEPGIENAEMGAESIQAYILSAVSEKTGYPAEVLDLDLDLEADLGIDTVKQAELFASIRSHWVIPRREDLPAPVPQVQVRLSDYNTLAKVIAFVEESLQAKTQAAAASEAFPAADGDSPEPAAGQDQAMIVRRVPIPSLRPRLDLCIPTGVNLVEGQRVLVVENNLKFGDALARKLSARKVEVLRLNAGLGAPAITEKLAAWQAEGPIHGVYFLPALEIEPKLAEMTIESWQACLEERLYSLYSIMKALPEEAFLVCATRMGGLHGYSAIGASAPLGGATSGFAKALAREREKAFVKVVDFEAGLAPAVIAARLVGETLQDPGALEIGWENDLRYGIAAVEQPLPAERNFSLEQGSVFLISGGSGGIIRPIVEDLARATCGTFYLLDRIPLPEADNPDILRLASDQEGLKKELIDRLTRDNKKPTPVQVEAALFAIERSATTLQTLHIVQQLGGKAHYLACDVTDPARISEAIQKIKDAEGHLDVFLHAAGMERSRKLEMKPLEEFRLVVSVKADGFFNLFKAMQTHGLLPRGVVFFSSVAGRFGNSGQTDYAAANDLLCKIASAIRSQHPEIKAIAIDWSAWGGVGMATRGNIPALMKMAGIELVPPEQAAPMVRLELLAGQGEAIIAGSLGALLAGRCPQAGMDLAKADRALRTGQPIHTMLSSLTGFDLNQGLTLEAELDPKTQPFLYDHTLNGTPILPGVMGIEGFMVAAKHIGSVLASARGGLEVGRLEDIRFLAPFKFYHNEPRRVTWVVRALRESPGLVVYVTLESCRTLKTGSEERIRHFSGKVYLKPPQPEALEANAETPEWNGNYTVKAEDIYRLYFHGPAFQVLEGVQRSGLMLIGKINRQLPSMVDHDHVLLSTPTLVEACFQTAGLWEIGQTGIMALPSSIESLTLYRQNVNGANIYAEVKPIRLANGELYFDARVVDSKGRLYLELQKYHTSPMADKVKPGLLAPLLELLKDS